MWVQYTFLCQYDCGTDNNGTRAYFSNSFIKIIQNNNNNIITTSSYYYYQVLSHLSIIGNLIHAKF